MPSSVGTVSPASLRVHGTVREELPNGPGEPIGSAQIKVVEKVAKELVTVTDPDGGYRVEGLISPYFQLQAGKNGYEPVERVVIDPDATDIAADLVLKPIRRTLVGAVTESFPTESAPIAGANVEIVTGSNKGKTVVTDSSGRYSLPDVWGEFDLSVSKAEFDATTVHASVDATVTTLDIKLLPDARIRRTSFVGRLCPPPFPYDGIKCLGGALQDHHWVNVHRAGDMAVSIDFLYNGDYYTDWIRMEVRCGAEMIAARWFMKRTDNGPIRIAPPGTTPNTGYFSGADLPLTVALPRACAYEIKLFDYFGFKGPRATSYVVELDHPK